MSHTLETVQVMYQAFSRGDVPTILAALAADVQWDAWEDNSLQRAEHPLYLRRIGPAQVADFFVQLRERVEIHRFEVLDIFGSGPQVAAEILLESTYRATGKRMKDEELHLFTFGTDGKIVRFRQYVDTAKHLRAAGLLAG